MTDEVTRDGLTVGAVADVAGVTVRTLHHWDEIGLARPSGRTPSGYRLYTQSDLDRIDRVLAYRESGLGLDTIRALLDDASPEVGAILREQRAQLAERIGELQRVDERLARMSQAHERGILLTDAEQIATFGNDWDPEQSQTARTLWGRTTQWAQFAERSASRSRADWQRLSDAMRDMQAALANAMDSGVEPGTQEAGELVERHRELFSTFFTLTRHMQVCLARMFEEDPGFASYYNGLTPGLASWFRQIVDEAARAHGIDPDTATWQ
ncbi:MerR family transcriptional regulator [Streptomyces sp. NPDC046862]|uniref:MerR family transcriptional regulator n=1 Tax=Streptomyces sp. NPDC046862 TaxID=3154603 RepID=UPI0034564B4E